MFVYRWKSEVSQSLQEKLWFSECVEMLEINNKFTEIYFEIFLFALHFVVISILKIIRKIKLIPLISSCLIMTLFSSWFLFNYKCS